MKEDLLMTRKNSVSYVRIFTILTLFFTIPVLFSAQAQIVEQDLQPGKSVAVIRSSGPSSEVIDTGSFLSPDKNIEKKLDKLKKYVKGMMKDAKVPGLAMGIVKDGKVIFARGFGYRDLEKKLPVTTKTLFAIGSCTKAFTTMAIGMLVDKGKVEWDKPVRDYLPAFTLKDEYITANMTVRDLVTHRSGLPRHDALWYGSPFIRKELFDRLRYLDFSAGFREKYQYNNLMFMTSGYLVGQVTNSRWEDFIAKRIFELLGMTDSNFSVEDSRKSADFARPYAIEDEKVKKIPFRNIDEIGPAGSINSCIDDMLKWIQFHLDEGKVGEGQLVSESEMKNMQTPYMHIASQMESNERSHANYGLGWSISMYRGHKWVQHGGGIDGFTTSTSFLPFDEMGIFVVNNAASPISSMAAMYAMDLLLNLEPVDRYAKMKESREKAKEEEKEKKKEEPVKGTQPSHTLADYAGVYEHPAYGLMTIAYDGDSLSGKFNTFNFSFEHYHYDVFKTRGEVAFREMKISFASNTKGDIDKLMVQLEPMVDDIVFSRKPSEKLSEKAYLEKFIGEYKIEEMVIKVTFKGDVLVAMPTGQPTMELDPYKENEFNFKGLQGYSVTFNLENGKAIEMVLHQPNGIFTAKRVK